MTKQIGGITLKGEKEALYTSKSWSNNRSSTKRGYNGDKRRTHQGTAQLGRAQKNDYNNSQGKRFEGHLLQLQEEGSHVQRLLVLEKICRKQCDILQHGDGGGMACKGTSTHGDNGRPYRL